jgi:carboxyvinyl-carboxyphosphonate phosphorylmutase
VTPMPRNDRRDAFRSLLTGQGCTRPAIVSDPLTARMADELGFELGMIPGSDVALAVLGAPDIALVTLTEFVEQVHRLTRATEMPLIADGDHGYGNAINVRRFVAELDQIGLCGVTIEDTELPAPHGTDKARLIPQGEAVGKLRAALAGRRDPRFAVIGRTNLALATGGLEDGISRLKAYAETGVDALFVQGVKSRAVLDAVSGAVDLPLVLPKPAPEIADPAYLAASRVRICFPLAPKAITAALDAAHATLVAQREGAGPLAAKHADLLRLLTQADQFDAARRDFLND